MSTKNYLVTIETQGYIHIGSGDKLGKKDYFESKNNVIILDQAKFIDQLNARERNEYFDFLQKSDRDRSTPSLNDYLRAKDTLRTKAQESQKYSLKTSLSQSKSGRKQNYEIFEYIKDPYGLPYVPGSSVKGMLRTAILAWFIDSSPAKYQSFYQREKKNKKRNLDNRLQDCVFNQIGSELGSRRNDAVSDIMRYVSIADSKALKTSDLCLVKKYDLFTFDDEAKHKRKMGTTRRNYFNGNELNIYRECLKPGTSIELRVSIDERINQYFEFALDKKGLETILRRFNAFYNECFLKYFYDLPPESGIYCHLGGGVDFISKTVLAHLFTDPKERVQKVAQELYDQFPSKVDKCLEKNQTLLRKIKQSGFIPDTGFRAKKNKKGRMLKAKDDHRHWMDPQLGVSPHTLKMGRTETKDLPMGECTIRFSPLP